MSWELAVPAEGAAAGVAAEAAGVAAVAEEPAAAGGAGVAGVAGAAGVAGVAGVAEVAGVAGVAEVAAAAGVDAAAAVGFALPAALDPPAAGLRLAAELAPVVEPGFGFELVLCTTFFVVPEISSEMMTIVSGPTRSSA